MTLSLKHDVKLHPLGPQMALAFPIVASVYQALGYEGCQITSGAEGEHRPKSLHPLGRALDFRWPTEIHNQRYLLMQACKSALGPDFDVVDSRVCMHIEWDPR